MLNIEKINTYKKYEGMWDWYSFVNEGKKDFISGEEWGLIMSLAQDIFLVNKNLTNTSYAERLNQKLKECCDSEETIAALKNIKDRYE